MMGRPEPLLLVFEPSAGRLQWPVAPSPDCDSESLPRARQPWSFSRAVSQQPTACMSLFNKLNLDTDTVFKTLTEAETGVPCLHILHRLTRCLLYISSSLQVSSTGKACE